MPLLLLLLLELFKLVLHVQAQPQQACPLNFTSIPYLKHESCELDQESGLEPSLCCKTALSYLSRVIAVHANETEGRPLFLEEAVEQVCWEQVQKLNLGVNYDYCEIAPPHYTAYKYSCNFGSVREVEQNLTIVKLNFADLLFSCKHSKPSACLAYLSRSSSVLEHVLEDSLDHCATALFISIISTDAKNSSWIDSLISASSHEGLEKKSRSRELAFEISLILVCSCIGLGAFIVLFLYLRRRRMNPQDSDKVGSSLSFEDKESHVGGRKLLLRNESLYGFSKKEIWKATKNFTSDNYIGAGSAGMVHKGVLPSGQLVAVKHIDKEKAVDTFFKEVENLSKLRHPHLVSLLGYCQSGEDYYLVYEYCANGNLWQWLFGDRRILTWEERLNIAVGSARGLFFLHTNPGGTIIHRDVKPTNILLNDNMEAKLSDFGLSKALAIEESHVYTEVKGTSGYLDPEYMTRGQLTLASDIYSFGIVLLQLVSGRRPIDFDLAHRYTLLTSAKRIIERNSNISRFVDPRLEGRYSAAAAKSIVEIAVFCTSQSSHNRPNIKEVKETVEAAWSISKNSSTPYSSGMLSRESSSGRTVEATIWPR